MPNDHKRIAVIGLGNALRRDDAVGIAVLESLLRLGKRRGVEYLNFGIASFDLIHRLQDYNAALLIDGVSAGLPAAELKIFDLQEIFFPAAEQPVSSHQLNLKDIFELSQKLGIKTKIYVAGIQVEDISFGQGLSRSLQEKLEWIAGQVDDFICKKLLEE